MSHLQNLCLMCNSGCKTATAMLAGRVGTVEAHSSHKLHGQQPVKGFQSVREINGGNLIGMCMSLQWLRRPLELWETSWQPLAWWKKTSSPLTWTYVSTLCCCHEIQRLTKVPWCCHGSLWHINNALWKHSQSAWIVFLVYLLVLCRTIKVLQPWN